MIFTIKYFTFNQKNVMKFFFEFGWHFQRVSKYLKIHVKDRVSAQCYIIAFNYKFYLLETNNIFKLGIFYN